MDETIISRIQEVMDHYGLTVSAFADEIGVQRSSISHLLNGRNKPSLDFVMKLVTAYPEVDLYWLMKGEGEFPKVASKGNDFTTESEEKEEETGEKTLDPSLTLSIGISQKDPIKIVLFYEDGTFETFNNKKG